LIDDHPLVREGLENLIHQQADLLVCGHAGTCAEALNALVTVEPDLLIADLYLPDGSGIDLIKTIKKSYPDLLVLVLSAHDEKVYAGRAIRAGAKGYVMKGETSSRLVEAIHRVLGGDLVISDEALSSFAAKLLTPPRAEPNRLSVARLSDRELEVFRMLGQGSDTRKIATALNISIKTVQSYCNRIKEKLGLDTPTQLFREAVLWSESQHNQA
jgi:DNA-binding NarL/FixJ family response regulator